MENEYFIYIEKFMQAYVFLRRHSRMIGYINVGLKCCCISQLTLKTGVEL